ncbi:CAP domain-containing protein [Candidatus Parcubacteria bacterium]|jgi:uncharacterized protein YkwD|nr:CAP domain-containing protein [Candidatus Parcubacteria bacterium]MBT7228358.1 CAP domain-containing protein [Candidatus Parcubacteria bacterium]
MGKKEIKKEILDSDADGLFDHEEEALGTDPNHSDTDRDQLGDYQEVHVYKTNPLDPDTDCDQIEDGVEVKAGFNPRGTGILRRLFIPNQCNHYKPHALHPHRIAFHAASAVVIKLVLVAFLFTFPVQAWLTPDVLFEQSQKIVQLTNNIRTNLGLNTLETDNTLQAAALDKAQDMLVNEYFAHVGPDNKSLKSWLAGRGYDYKIAGENLAIGFSSAEDVVDAWVGSPVHYANMIDTDYDQIGVGAVSGNYKEYDTTLIAQYFGTKKTYQAPEPTPEPATPEPTPTPEPTLTPEPVEIPEVEPIVEPTPDIVPTEPSLPEIPELEPILEEEIEVLAESVVSPLSVPTLFDPIDRSVLKNNLVSLNISAPNATQITVFDNNKEIITKAVNKDTVNVSLDLGEGLHTIVIDASNGEETISSSAYTLTVDTIAPTIDSKVTNIMVSRPLGDEAIVMKADALLSEDVSQAEVIFKGNIIKLNQDPTDINKWSGNVIINDQDYDELMNPIIMATIRVKDRAGNIAMQDIDWKEVTPVDNSALDQYLFLKNNQSEHIKPLFDFSAIYYKVILVLAIFALLLNIFIEIKKQHPHTILSTLGLILLMGFLTIF